MDKAIVIIDRIRAALGTLQITSTRSNMDTLLGCIQLCDRAIDELQAAKNANGEEADGQQN